MFKVLKNILSYILHAFLVVLRENKSSAYYPSWPKVEVWGSLLLSVVAAAFLSCYLASLSTYIFNIYIFFHFLNYHTVKWEFFFRCRVLRTLAPYIHRIITIINTEQFSHLKTMSLVYPFILTFSPYLWLLANTDLFSIYSFFENVIINGIIQYVAFWD